MAAAGRCAVSEPVASAEAAAGAVRSWHPFDADIPSPRVATLAVAACSGDVRPDDLGDAIANLSRRTGSTWPRRPVRSDSGCAPRGACPRMSRLAGPMVFSMAAVLVSDGAVPYDVDPRPVDVGHIFPRRRSRSCAMGVRSRQATTGIRGAVRDLVEDRLAAALPAARTNPRAGTRCTT